MATYPYPNDVNGLYSFPSTVIQDALGCANLVQQAYFEYYLLNGLPPVFGYPAWSDLVTMPPAGYTLLYNIYYDGIEFLDPSVVPYYGYVAQIGSSGEIFFVLRGTETITEWFDDIVLSNQVAATTIIPNISSAALVHDGFGKIYSDLRYYPPAKTGNPAVKSGSPLTLSQVLTALQSKMANLVVTGHSLGAALATLLTMDISLNYPASGSPLLTAYTLASPTVGDPNFAKAFLGQITTPAQGTLQITNYRIANGWDSVPNLPPGTYDDPFADFGSTEGQYFYQQVAGFCPVDGGLTTDESIAHSLNAYATGLNNLLNPPAAGKALPSGKRRRSEGRRAALPLVAPGVIGEEAAALPQ